MILSHQSIQKLLGNVILNFNQESVRENGYDLRICGERYFEVLSGSTIPSKNAELRELNFGEFAEFEPFKTYLFETCEELKMPNDLAALITLRSTLARNGFILPPTIIDAGYEGKITLAISSFYRSKIKNGSRVAHVVFIRLDEPTEKPYDGRYKGGRII